MPGAAHGAEGRGVLGATREDLDEDDLGREELHAG
jgi:hypothetical protein